LPASIVNGVGDSFWKRPDFQLWMALDRSYCIPSCITCRPLPTCQISLKSKKLCGRTDGHLRPVRPALLGRLCRRVDLNTRVAQKKRSKQ